MTAALKAFTPTFKAVGAEGTASFAVATFGLLDADGDVTEPGYFGRQNVVVVPAHDWSHVPLGKGLLYEHGDEAIAEVRFNMAIPAARDWHAAIRFDFENPPALQEYSYGYTVLSGGSRAGKFDGRAVRFLQPRSDGSPGCKVHEVSPVLLGAGATRTVAAKQQADASTGADTAGMREFLRFVAFQATHHDQREAK